MDDQTPIRVLVADDHPAMRRALAQIVSDNERMDLIGEAEDGQVAGELIASQRPDVALVDVRMPIVDGLGLVRRVRADGLPVRVVLLTGYDDSAIVHEAVSAGAVGVLSKLADEDEIAAAIVEVAEGRSVLSPGLQSGLLDEIRLRAPSAPTLSIRERELLELAAQGTTNAEIARRLSLSPNTVKTYWQRVYEKLGSSDRAGAVAEAIRRGLVR
jgi:two-component system nitrate/nitrite response regulator NarL